MGFETNLSGKASRSKTNESGTTVRKKHISQEGIDKLVYDVLSADEGLAQLVSMEGIAGGRSSSTKTMMAQDFATKLIGELATITAEDVTKVDTVSRSKGAEAGGGVTGKSVICTELIRQGKLDKELHARTHEHWLKISPYTKRGYWLWAPQVVKLMQRSEVLSSFLAPIATRRCQMIVEGRTNISGLWTIYLGQPVCYLIGRIAALGDKNVSIESCA